MLLLLLFVAMCVCAGHVQAHSHKGLETVIESRAAECDWIPKNRKNECPTEPPMDNDVLKRRQSGLLAAPGNQGSCGNCWAFAAVHTLTDRLSISMNQLVPLISPEDLTTCIDHPNVPNGCCGADKLYRAYDYIMDPGTVDDTCKPYSKEGYAYNDFLPNNQQAPIDCSRQCANRNIPYNPTSYGIRGYKRLTTVAEMMTELENGPITAAILVTDEFRSYACGIFCSDGNNYRGGHAVEIVDYGTENGLDYWVVKNSWGLEYGEQGYFRTRRGHNDLNIENWMVYAPIISGTVDETPQQSGSNTIGFSLCGPVSEDTQDVDVQEVAQFVVKSLQDKISCSTGTIENATLTVENVDRATCQIVAGDLFTLEIDAKLEGCSDEAYIVAQVYVDLDGKSTLVDYQYYPNNYKNVATSNNVTPVMYLFVLFAGMLLHDA